MNNVTLILIFFVFLKTNINGQDKIFDFTEYTVKEINSDKVKTDSEFYIVSDLLFNKDEIIITDKSNEPTIQIFTVENALSLKILKYFGSAGQGPGEFIDTWDIFRDETGELIYIFDAVNRRIAVLNNDYEIILNDYIYVKSDGFYTTVNKIDNYFIGSGVTSGCVLEIFDRNGEITECRGTHPDLGLNSEVSVRSVAQRWHSYTVMHPAKDKIAIFYRFANRARIVNLNGETIKELVDSDFGVPITQAMNGNALPTNIDLRAYISVDANDEFIYALYSGEISTGPSSSLGRFVQKYDWDLNLIDVYKLDHLAINIHVDKNNNLYTLEYEPENNIRLLNTE